MSKIVLSTGQKLKWPKKIIAYTDGASRGNPGVSSYGLKVIDEKNQTLFEEAGFLGVLTNNLAEYRGLYRLLELAVQNKVNSLVLKTDSELAVRQLKGIYKVKSKNLKPLYTQCKNLMDQIPQLDIVHVFREENKRADELANLALDSLNGVE